MPRGDATSPTGSEGFPSVTVIVPVRNGAQYIRSCLDTIAADPYPAHLRTVLVADNGSTDDSAVLAASLGAQVVSVAGVPVSELRNRAAATASTDLLAFVDVDHEMARGWMRAAVGTLGDSTVGAVGAPYRSPEHPSWVQTMYDSMRSHPRASVETRWLGAGNLVIRRTLFEQVGGFDSTLEACEDVDLCRRVRGTGARLIANPAMVSVHKGDPRTLSALFFGELWRGRDNVRVSLRPPVAWSDLPSLLVPVLWWLTALAAVIAAATTGRVPAALAAAGGAVIACAVVGRAALMIRRASLPPGIAWLQALVVAAVYDSARALSLVWRATHSTRSTSGPVPGEIRG